MSLATSLFVRRDTLKLAAFHGSKRTGQHRVLHGPRVIPELFPYCHLCKKKKTDCHIVIHALTTEERTRANTRASVFVSIKTA